jgi:hypothetical protein
MKIKTLACLIILFMAAIITTEVNADEVMRGFIIQQDAGQLKACMVISYKEAVCWELYGPALSCIPITEDNPTLLCNVTEVKTY